MRITKLFLFSLLVGLTLIPPFTVGAVPADCDLQTGQCAPMSQEQIDQLIPSKSHEPVDEYAAYWKIGYTVLWVLLLLGIARGAFFVVPQQSAVVIERLGKFSHVANPGLNFKVPLLDCKAGTMDLRVQQMDLKAETKTQDNVFVHVSTSVQYYVLPEQVYAACYKLQNPEKQISSYVFDVIRSKVPKLNLDDAFQKKEEVAVAVKQELIETMQAFGYGILTALVTEVDPDERVKISMNEINAAQRLRVAANEKGEAESKRLQGEGIANQRKAIIKGLEESVKTFKEAIPGSSEKDVMSLVLLTQYFDTLQHIGSNDRSNTILVPHSPAALSDISAQIREALLITKDPA